MEENKKESIQGVDIPISAYDLSLKDFPEEDFVVDYFNPENSVSTLFGLGGIGKSYLMLHKCIHIVLGREWFGKFRTKKCSILWIDKEDDEREFNKRLHKLMNGLGLDDDEKLEVQKGIHYINPVWLISKKNSDIIIKDLSNQIKELNIGFVIYDSYMGMSVLSNVTPEEIIIVYSVLRRVCQATNSACDIIDHETKGFYFGAKKVNKEKRDRLYGGVSKFNLSRAVTNVEKDMNGMLIIEQIPKNRKMTKPFQVESDNYEHIENNKMDIDKSYTTFEFVAESVAKPEKKSGAEILRDNIVTWVKTNGIQEFKKPDVLKLKGYSYSKWLGAKAILKQEGIIDIIGATNDLSFKIIGGKS